MSPAFSLIWRTLQETFTCGQKAVKEEFAALLLCMQQTFIHEKTTKVLVYNMIFFIFLKFYVIKSVKSLMSKIHLSWKWSIRTQDTVLKSSTEAHMKTFWTGSSQEVTACLLCAFPGHFLKTTVGKCRNGSSDDRQCNHSNTRTHYSSQPSYFMQLWVSSKIKSSLSF